MMGTELVEMDVTKTVMLNATGVLILALHVQLLPLLHPVHHQVFLILQQKMRVMRHVLHLLPVEME
jgi:hypothetical protein